ncbi:MAG: tetratricopeptide repeat protein [Saprospirales bacterium]|nr:tetratricopeptide repeat protein [Saprospirales bacterium]MBK8921896.1 tetratricopeptide repeat protein [Saprospirales bacterium]
MKRILISALVYTFTCSISFAQDRSFGTLPLAQKPNAVRSPGAKMEESPKYQRALEIYNRLVAARGDFRFPVPKFFLRKEAYRLAGIDYESLEITLEEKAYDVCLEYGDAADAALAFLLGHELTHYYEKHAWRRGFAADYKDLPIGIKLDSLIDDTANETEADYLGGFLAYSAGYGLFDKGPDVIEKLYKAYDLSDQLRGYPSLSDRKILTQRAAENLGRLVALFDMANLLTAIANYEEAYEYYRYILMSYQSRELYNNLGVMAVLHALTFPQEGAIKYRFPLELDLESSGTKGSSGMAEARSKLLRQALLHFDAAISLDPDYAPAYLNKACTHLLLGDAKRARFYAEEEARPIALDHSYPKTALDVDVLMGILEATLGNTGKAAEIFTAAAGAGSALAALNLRILNKEQAAGGGPEVSPGAVRKTEKIDGQSIASINDALEYDDSKTINLQPTLIFLQNPVQGANSRLLISQNDAKGRYTLFHLTGPGYAGPTAQRIGLGADRAAIIKAYSGEPESTLETPTGQIMVYDNIIFILGAGGKLERWATYMIVK